MLTFCKVLHETKQKTFESARHRLEIIFTIDFKTQFNNDITWLMIQIKLQSSLI